MNDFFADIAKFNAMYRMPAPVAPMLDMERIQNFEKILTEEVEEFSAIYEVEGNESKSNADVLTAIADLYGDIIIYFTSALLSNGFDPKEVLGIIMQSNFSKLDANGNPIYDERGKVLKGPNYWKPEPMLKAYIEQAQLDTAKAQTVKWCTYCCKDTHNDSECSCTRILGWKPKPWQLNKEVHAAKRSEIIDSLPDDYEVN